MALYYAKAVAGLASRPIIKPSSGAYGGRGFRFRAHIDLAAVDSSTYGTTTGGVAFATTDWIELGIIPAGYYFDYGMLTSSVSLGTSVVAIGTNPTHASNGQYRAAATFTAVDTPTLFGLAAAKAGGVLAADTPVYLTLATAALPTSGTLVVDIYATKP